MRLAGGTSRGGLGGRQTWREPGARVLRVGFGVIWLFDGLLQAQPQMAGGLAGQVIRPPRRLRLAGCGTSSAGASPPGTTTPFGRRRGGWIQVGIGLWLIVAVRGWSAGSRDWPGSRGG